MMKKGEKAKSQMRPGTLFFVLGITIAIIGGLIYGEKLNIVLSSVLIVLGIIVGLHNVTLKETNSFLLATISLVIISSLGRALLSQIPTIGNYIEGILFSIMTFVVPAAIIVALKSIISLAEEVI